MLVEPEGDMSLSLNSLAGVLSAFVSEPIPMRPTLVVSPILIVLVLVGDYILAPRSRRLFLRRFPTVLSPTARSLALGLLTLLILAQSGQTAIPALVGGVAFLGSALLGVLALGAIRTLSRRRDRLCSARVRVFGVAICAVTFLALGHSGLANGWATTDRVVATTLDTPPPISGPSAYLHGASPIAAGGYYTLALQQDGTVRSWGANYNGALGTDTPNWYGAPATVLDLDHIVSIAAGDAHNLALREDGTVWAWGLNSEGQLGDGTTDSRSRAVRVGTLAHVIAVAAGGRHSLALKDDGTVWAWGNNWAGQLGDGDTNDTPVPTQVIALSGVTAIDAGWAYSLALLDTGTVSAWGRNDFGQLGDGTHDDRTAPVAVGGLSGITALSAAGGASNSLALDATGAVWAWGANWGGRLATGNTVDDGVALPAQVLGLGQSAIAVAAGQNHMAAILADGTARAWGEDGDGQLGDGLASFSSTPVTVFGVTEVVAVSAGGAHNIVLLGDGTVRTWGSNGTLQLGDIDLVADPSPRQVDALRGVTAIAGGSQHTLALRTDGTVWSWGSAEYGQLGDNTLDLNPHPQPRQVSNLTGIVAISAAWFHSVALKNDGTVWIWGRNTVPSNMDSSGTVLTAAPVQVAGLSDIVAISTRGYHRLALKSDGTVWAWGYNGFGEIGVGTYGGAHPLPAQVSGLTGIVAIAAGNQHSLALDSSGTLYSWGRNDDGELARGGPDTYAHPTPLAIPQNLTGASALSGGGAHSLALVSGGSIWAWGNNRFGQLGDGSNTLRNTPQAVSVVTNVTSISAGSVHTLALESDGTVWAWGKNIFGELGQGSMDNGYTHSTPVQVPGLSGVGVIAAGGGHSLAIKGDVVWAWGENYAGQIGTPIVRKVAGLGTVGLPDFYMRLHHGALSTPWNAQVGLGVNAVFGTFGHQQADLVIPGRGPALVMARTYNSADPFDVGFGPGWSFTYGMMVVPEARATVVVSAPDGRRDRYTVDTAAGGTYAAAAGIYDRLARGGDGTYILTTSDQLVYTFDLMGRLVSVADRNNNMTTLAWTTTGLANGTGGLTITEPTGRQTPPADRQLVLSYGTGADRYHFVRLEEQNILGRVVQYAYSGAGDLETVTDPRNNTIGMTYDRHHLLTVTDQESRTLITNVYDPQWRVGQQTDGRGKVRGFDYTVAGQTTVNGPRPAQDGRADRTIYKFDTDHRVMRVTDPLGDPGTGLGNVAFERDTNHNPTCVTDRLGGKTRREYDNRGNVVRLVDAAHADGSCQGTVAASAHYNERNGPEWVVDANGHRTDYGYYPDSHLLRDVQAPAVDGWRHKTMFVYDPSGNGDLRSAQDENGFVTNYQYDRWGNRTTISDPSVDPDSVPSGGVARIEYDAGGRPTVLTDVLQHRTDYTYQPVTDPRERAATILHPSAATTATTTTSYDYVGRVKAVNDANNHLSTYDFDAVGNLTSQGVFAFFNPASASSSYQYDEDGNRSRWTDPDGRVTDYDYDLIGRLKNQRGPADDNGVRPQTHYDYDDALRRVALQDPNGRTTTTTYDQVGRIKSIAYPQTGTETYRVAFTVSYEYDDVGNRLKMTQPPAGNGDGITHYGYDALDRPILVDSPQRNLPDERAIVRYGYDQQNSALGGARNCTTLTYPQAPHDPRVRVAASCYDQAGRLKSVRDWDNQTTNYNYDPAGRLWTASYHNTTTATYTYDDADRLTGVTNTRQYSAATMLPSAGVASTPTVVIGDGGVDSPGGLLPTRAVLADLPTLVARSQTALISKHIYTPDRVGNRTGLDEVTATREQASDTATQHTSFEYDIQDRLKTATYPMSGRSYTYSPGGNRLTFTATTTTNGTATTASSTAMYASDGRLRQAPVQPGGQPVTYGYDPNGNQVSKAAGNQGGNLTSQYDGANRLVMALGDRFANDPQHNFVYNGDGLLVGEKPWIDGWQRYTYDTTADNPVALMQSGDDDTGRTVFSLYGLGLIARYVTQTDVSGVPTGDPPSYLYFHYDGVGSTRAVTDGNGTLQAAYDFDPYGGKINSIVGDNRSPDNAVQFAGEPYNEYTGQYYLRARRYDPATGRFTQPDPSGLAGGQNLYAYAANNPVTRADHSGYADVPAQPGGATGSRIKPPDVVEGGAGSFKDLRNRARNNDNLTPHHMPQDKLNFLPRDEGGALVLPFRIHAKTRTYGYPGSVAAKADAGKTFREVLNADIRDVRNLAQRFYGDRTYYNSGLQGLLDYYRTNYPHLLR